MSYIVLIKIVFPLLQSHEGIGVYPKSRRGFASIDFAGGKSVKICRIKKLALPLPPAIPSIYINWIIKLIKNYKFIGIRFGQSSVVVEKIVIDPFTN